MEENLGGDSYANPHIGSLSAYPLLAFDVQPLPHQPNDADVGVVEPEPEPDAEEDDDAAEVDDEAEAEAEADDDADDNAERPKLDEGYYEIEAIRRKRVRKTQRQYLIKWRGWPETANTWEPLENLQSCSDFIDAFEESLRSGKQRKRKRKSGGTPHTHVKKRQQRSTVASYNNRGMETNDINKPLSSAAIGNLSIADNSALPQSVCLSGQEQGNGIVNNNGTSKKVNGENGVVNVVPKCSGRRNRSEYDPKLSELKATTSTSNADRLAIHFQEGKGSEGNGTVEGISRVNCTESVQNTRSIGAKRRKSGSVKRIKPEMQLCETPVMQNLTIGTNIVSGGRVELIEAGNHYAGGGNSSYKNKTNESENASRITKILKPIGYSATVMNNVQDVSVTFMAMRADGREVMVDNKFLKANNPLLLISYYEQHLRYSPTS